MNRQCFAKLQSKNWAYFGNGRLSNRSWECFLTFLLVSAFHLCMWMLKLLRVGIRSKFFHSWGNEVWFFCFSDELIPIQLLAEDQNIFHGIKTSINNESRYFEVEKTALFIGFSASWLLWYLYSSTREDPLIDPCLPKAKFSIVLLACYYEKGQFGPPWKNVLIWCHQLCKDKRLSVAYSQY